ncbi:MAG: hypothetical protein JWN86_3030 [Planctomycetota bacterium]|nr:hypothetical protein [Planctomycetota bacterium]
MAIEQSQLNERAIEAAGFLAKAMPRRLAGMRVGEQGGHCEIELDNPFESDRPVLISTAGGEVTVSFGECHTHYDDLRGMEDEATLVEQMVVKAILLTSGAEVSYSAWSGDRCLGCGWLREGVDRRDGFGHFPEADRLKFVGWEPWGDAELCRNRSDSPAGG